MVLSRFRQALCWVGNSGRALTFVTCDRKVGDGLDVFDVPCVVTTKVFFTLPYAPTLPMNSFSFAVWSIIEGLEGDISGDVLNTSMLRSAGIRRL